MKFSNTVTIKRRPTEVFAFLSHFENVPLWNYAINDTRRLDAGPVGVGARYQQTRTIPTQSVEEFEVIEFEPDHRLGIRGILGLFQAESGYLLEAAGETTVLTNVMQLEPSSALGLLASLAGRSVQGAVATNLIALKELLEHGRVSRATAWPA